MKLLESLHAREFKTITFYPRKVSIKSPKTILFGPRASGKTTILLDHLSREKKGSFLYIDFNDLRLDQAIFIGLPSFIKSKKISLLVLDNFDFSFTVPKCDRVIISTTDNRSLDGYDRVEIYPLDFEEFIASQKIDLDIESIFNNFATIGTYPAMLHTPKDRFIKEFQYFLRSMFKSDLELAIFKSFALMQGEIINPYAIFNDLKIFHKLSKDKFYEVLNRFQEERLIFLVQRYNKPKANKKLYLIDFAIKSVLTFDKDFIKRFENIIFLELLKSGEKCYYTDLIEFYIPSSDLAILPMLFSPLAMIEGKLNRIKKDLLTHKIKRVEVITLEVSLKIDLDGIECEVLPFWEWALRR